VAKAKKKTVAPDGVKVLVRNKRAFHDYDISERVEAGLVLLGSEVKSLRDGRANIKDGHVSFRNGEAWLVGIQINEYKWANRFNHDMDRTRKLLLHTREIKKLAVKVEQRGFTIVPLSLYLKNGRVKVELGVGRGKREYEKRNTKRDMQAKREIDQAIKRRR
jgi:SsrA-binding protein